MLKLPHTLRVAVFALGALLPILAQAQARFQGTPYPEYRTADGCAFALDSTTGNNDEWWLISATASECSNGLVHGPMLFTLASFWTTQKLISTHTQFAYFDKGRYQGWMFSIYKERGSLFATNYPAAYYLSRDNEAALSTDAMKRKVTSLIDEFQKQSRLKGYANVMKPFSLKIIDLWQADSRSFIQKLNEGVSTRTARVISLDDVQGSQSNTTRDDDLKATGRGARGD